MSSFADLLHRADKLSSSVQSTKQDVSSSGKKGWAFPSVDTSMSKGVQPFAASTNNRLPTLDTSGVEPNLDQILKRGETLWRKTTTTGDRNISTAATSAGLHASLLLGKEGVAMPSLPEPYNTSESGAGVTSIADITLTARRDTASKAQESDLQLFLRNQREHMLTNLVEETLKNTMDDAERMHWRQMVQDWEDHKKALFKGIPSVNVSEMVPGPANRRMERSGPRSRSQMTDVELIFAKKMSEYIDASAHGGLPPNLVALFAEAVVQLKDTALVDLWEQVKEVIATPVVAGQSIAAQRVSVDWSLALIKQSTNYLQKHFCKHMEVVVYGNLEQARRGGVPGIIGLIQAYLNVRFATPYQGHEDGLVDNRHPVWAVVYYCIRSGDLSAARQVCEQMRLGDMAAALRQLQDGDLSADTETKMRLEFRRKVLTGTDAYKRAVFCVVANCDSALDHPEVADKIEDWLWLRLTLARHGELKRRSDPADKGALAALQNQISVEYGEQHFGASGSPLMYWAALWLTGQLEAAIEFLARQGDQLRAHAVHVAIAANQVGILLTPKDCRVKLLSSDEGDGAELRRLNVARLVMLYTAKFETSDVREALCYMYLLRAFKAPGGEDLLEASVARLLAQSKEYDLLLGYMDESGKRMPGLVDRFKLNTARIISHVARESESAGDNDTAIKLFDLAGKSSDAIRLLNMELSQVISQPCMPQSQCERVRRLAVTLATRYKRTGSKIDPQLASTLYLLIDFGTFFDFYHEKRYDECIDVLRKLNCLPLEPDEVDQKVKIFHMIPEEIRRVLSDILLALMNISVEQYKQLKQSTSATNGLEQQALADIRSQAQAVILFAGMIPYRLPADTNGRLVQLEAYLS